MLADAACGGARNVLTWSMAPASLHRLHQRQALAAPMAYSGDDRLGQRAGRGSLVGIARRKQGSPLDRHGGKRNVHRELRLDAVTDTAAGGAHRTFDMCVEEG